VRKNNEQYTSRVATSFGNFPNYVGIRKLTNYYCSTRVGSTLVSQIID
jgi:hypothetical protein